MKKIKKAFTLVELMVVIAILAILAAVSVVGYTSFIDREKERSAITEATQAREVIIAEVIKTKKGEIPFNISPPNNGVVTLSYNNGELYVKTEPGIIHNDSEDKNGFNAMLRKTFPSLAPLPGFFTIDGSTISYHSDYGNESENIIVDVVTGEVVKHKDKDTSSSSGGEGSGTETPSTSTRVTATFGQSYLKMSPGTPFTVLYEVTGPAGTISSLTQSGDSVSFENNGSSIKVTALKEGTTYIFLSATDGKSKAEAKLTVVVDKDSKTPVALPIQKKVIIYDGKEHGKFGNEEVQKIWDIPTGVELVDSQPGIEPTGTGSPENHYYATFKITDDTKYCWAIDATTGTQQVEWKINKIELAKPYQVNHPTFLDGAFFDSARDATNTEKKPEWDNGDWKKLYNSKLITIDGETGRERPGEYTTTFILTNEAYNHYCWKEDINSKSINVKWHVYKEEVEIPTITDAYTIDENGVYVFEYTGNKITPNVKLPKNGSITKSGTTSATECGTYTMTLKLDLVLPEIRVIVVIEDERDLSDCFEWADGTMTDKTITWKIVPKTLKKPVQKGILQYTGREQTASWNESYGKYVTITGNKQTNAGEYTATFTLTDTNNYKWAGSSTATETANWKIEKAVVDAPIEDGKAYEYKKRQEYGPEKSNDYNKKFKLVSGTAKASTQGDYTSVLELIDPNNYKWKDTNETRITINWSIMRYVDIPFNSRTTKSFEYDGSKHNPISSYDEDALDVTITGGNCVAPGTYTATFKLKDKCAWSDGTTGDKSFTWTINKASVPVPAASYGKTSFEYNGNGQYPTWNVEDNKLVTTSGANAKRTNAGDYTTVFKLVDPANSSWSDGTTEDKQIDWKITVKQLTIPTFNNRVSRSSRDKSGYYTFTANFNNFNDTYMSVNNNFFKSTNKNATGSGIATFSLNNKSGNNYKWADGTTTDKSVNWKK